jgi:hypothetical protein
MTVALHLLNRFSLERMTHEVMARALRAPKFVSNQLPRAVCNLGYYEGQVERQASAAIGPQTAQTSL